MKNSSTLKKNIVISIAIILLTIISFQSCENSSDKTNNVNIKKEIYRKLCKHIVLNRTTYMYHVKISREDASKLGITNEFYDELVRDLGRMNKLTKEVLKAKNYSLSLKDYQNDTTLVINKGDIVVQ